MYVFWKFEISTIAVDVDGSRLQIILNHFINIWTDALIIYG